MDDAIRCDYWDPSGCDGSRHCPPRCPRFVDSEGDPLVITPAERSDSAALTTFYAECNPGADGPDQPPFEPDRRSQWATRVLERGCNLLAKQGSDIVGHALYTPSDVPDPEFVVTVHPDVRNRGIGAELAKHGIATAAAGDREALIAVLDERDRPAYAFFDDLGFEIVDQFTYQTDGVRQTRLRMRLPLDSHRVAALQRPPVLRE